MSSNPKVFLHPNAVPAFNEQGENLVSQVSQVPHVEPQAHSSTSMFVPVATFTSDQIKNMTEMTANMLGEIQTKFKDTGEHKVGLDESAYRSLRLLAEKIQRTEGFREHVSLKALEETIFDWALERHGNATEQNLCEHLLEYFEARIKEFWVWIPIHGLITEFDFDLGNVEIHPFRPAFFETWETQLKKYNIGEDGAQTIVESARRQFQGHAACTMKIVAEPIRAREIAFAETENALAILRTFQPCIMHPLIPSYIRPLGREHLQGSTCIIIASDLAHPPDSHGEEPFEYWMLNQDMMDALLASGLGALHFMYRDAEKSDYEKDLWKSIWTYSRSSLQKSPEDRLIYVFRALESFLLKNKNEYIQQNIAERIAFTVASNAKERQEIVRTVVKVYGFRSDVVHHNRSIEETDLLIEFLQIVFKFFLLAIGRRKEFKTREMFLEEVEKLKFA